MIGKMALIEFINMEGKKDQFHMSDWLCKQLDKVKKLINSKDRDFVMVIDGPEGSGKSTLAAQIAYYVDPTFTQDRMCLNPDEFIEGINTYYKKALVYDEAYAGLGSSSVLSPINKLLTSMMMEMRKKNLFVILVLPSIFYLSKYAALHRAQCLLHTYFKSGRRGGFMSYNPKKMSKLYLYGKRKMSYSYPTIHIKQRFVKKTPIDWKIYEQRKIDSLKPKKVQNRHTELQIMRQNRLDRLVYILKDRWRVSNKELSKIFKENGLKFPADTIQDAVVRAKACLEEEKIEKKTPDLPILAPMSA